MAKITKQPSTQQPETTNLLSTNKFRVVIGRFPNIDYFTQSVPIPNVTLGVTRQYTNQETDIDWPGDKIEFEDLIVSVLVDENLAGFREILNWSYDIAKAGHNEKADFFSDISIHALSNSLNANKVITFHNSFPYNISNVILDSRSTEDQALSVDVIFKYSHYTME